MLKNKRGEAITIAVATVAGIAILLGLLFRPILDKVLPMFGNNQKIVSTKVVESKPVWIKNPDGTSTMVQTTSTVMNNSTEPVKLTFLQKVQNLGVWGIILVILGCLFPPFGAVLAFIWKKLTTQIVEWTTKHDELSAETKKIVASVDDGIATMNANIKATNLMADSTTDVTVKTTYITISKALMDMREDFLDALSKKQDSTTKLLVAELKHDDSIE